ncbi:MAG: AAA family ATPase [bacterium]|nr:AAA family ATPase [bacterium]
MIVKSQDIEFTRTSEIALGEWFKNEDRKPLLVRGARQVGKSFLVRKWAKEFLSKEKFLEVNLEEQPKFRELFKRSLDPADILKELNLLTGFSFSDGSLLFIDEIQACPQALTALRYFYEKMPKQLIIAAGSLLEFILEEVSFPVGRVQSLYLFPMSFSEFLGAVKGVDFRERFNSLKIEESVPTLFHNELNALLKTYFRVGGMPKAVKRYIENFDIASTAVEQKEILQDYLDDIGKFSKRVSWEVLQVVFSRLPSFMLLSNIKLSKLGNGLRADKVRTALRLFELAHLITRISSSSASKPPLEGFVDPNRSKYAFLDLGLLQIALGFDWSRLSLDVDLLNIYDGVFAEQFVAQEFLCSQSVFSKPKLYYWDRSVKGSEAEVDFLIETHNKIIPVEVKNSPKGRLKSLHLYLQEKQLHEGFVLCQRNVEKREGIKWAPLYMASKFSSQYL